MSFTPTPEQIAALDLFETGETLAIEAGAGTGKTSTLLLLSESAPKRRGQYVAFNKAIVEESKSKFPSHVACNTAHSLAFRTCGTRFQGRLRTAARMKSIEIANLLGVDPIAIEAPGGRKVLGSPFLAGVAMRAVTRFCQSADSEPTWRHVPYLEGLDSPLPDGRRGTANNHAIAKSIEPAIRKAWADLTRVDGRLPFKHDVYLKLAHLEGLRIGADFILFDECQDANPVLVAIVEAQEHAQIVWVGDSQQQIYAFTGAVNALGAIAADRRTFLTQSFRFGPAIAEQANEILSWIPTADLRLVGTDSIPSKVGEIAVPDAILTRTNATAVRTVLEELRGGRRPHLVGGGREIVAFADAAEALQNGQRTFHPELACFESWAEVQDYVELDEQGDELRLLVSLVDEFGVPTIKEALGNMAPESKCDLVVSTAHKSKGREWGSVQIASDFLDDREKLGDDEKRLLYVAVTRAKLELDVSRVAVLDPKYDTPEQAAAREEAERRRVERAAARAAAEEAKPKPAPAIVETGRYEISGVVISTKVGRYGRLSMLVGIDNGPCRVFGPVPDEIAEVQRGQRVAFRATVDRSDTDETFGFFDNVDEPRFVDEPASVA